jgi:threonine dehydratase
MPPILSVPASKNEISEPFPSPKISALTEYNSLDPEPPRPSFAGIPNSFLLSDGYPDYLRLILTSRVYEITQETALTFAVNLSGKLGVRVVMKREDLQPVFSFKIRGAYNKMAHISEEDRWKGVVACSAGLFPHRNTANLGNHAQGVAYSARHLSIPSTIVMPLATPSIKHQNVSRLGSKVLLHGQDFDEAKVECHRLQKLHGLIDIPPYDDPYVIAGQGTIGLELLRQTNPDTLEAIFCCIGGGGLIAGVASYVKRIAPHVKVFGVEAYDACAMKESLDKGERVVLNEVGLFADGAAVRVVGEETFRICKELVDGVILVDTDELCSAIKDVFEGIPLTM